MKHDLLFSILCLFLYIWGLRSHDIDHEQLPLSSAAIEVCLRFSSGQRPDTVDCSKKTNPTKKMHFTCHKDRIANKKEISKKVFFCCFCFNELTSNYTRGLKKMTFKNYYKIHFQ